jgi:hypothetical protein
MRIKLAWILVVVLGLALNLNAQVDDDDDPSCTAMTNAVQIIRVPQDCGRTQDGIPFYTFTNAGNFRFVIETQRVFQVFNEYPFEAERLGIFNMREGDTYEFFLYCNWDRGTTHIVFFDATSIHIPVARLPVGAFDLYTAGTISTNTQWVKVQSFTNNVANSLFYAPFYRNEPQRYYQVRAGL